MKQQKKLAAVIFILANGLSHAQTSPEVLLVEGQYPPSDRMIVTDFQDNSADSAELLKILPGAAVNRNGGLTGLAQYRGMYGARVSVNINEVSFVSGGPNSMDSPLSYIPRAQLQNWRLAGG